MIEAVSVWKISVAGYGAFLYVGTEAEAEEMRSHKSNWERAVGRRYWVRGATAVEMAAWRKDGPFHARDLEEKESER